MFWANKSRGFTIVELLIVVVVIAILAAITIVGYNGITRQAKNSALQSDITSAIKKIETAKVSSSTGAYPASLSAIGVTSTSLTYNYVSENNTYCVEASNDTLVYSATNDSTKVSPVPCGQNGLVGWWRLNGDGVDSSQNGYSGTTNATTSEIGQNSQPNQALGFTSAATSSVVIPSVSALNTDPQTFSMWIRPTSWSSPTASTILAKRTSSSNGYFIAYLNGSTSLIFDCGSSGASNRYTPGYAPPLNTWTHIVFTCSQNTGVALYVNGSLTGTPRSAVDRSAMALSTASLRIGQDSSSSGALLWNGSIDDVRMFNRVLTPTEIAALTAANAQ